MAWFDLIAVVLLGISAFQGAWRGMASQLSPILSLGLGYLVAIPISKDLAPWFGTEAPGNRFLAALAVYVAIAFAVHMVVGFFRETLAQFRMASFDHHLGFLLGGAKGTVLCMLMAFFGIGLSEKSREAILESRAGEVSVTLLRKVEPMLPGELRDILDDSFNAIADINPAKPIAPPTAPNWRHRSAPQEDSTRWASDWLSNDEPSPPPTRIETPPRRPSAFLKEAARIIETDEPRRR
jgi:uncharacterized membrane protein required for colicin V production